MEGKEAKRPRTRGMLAEECKQKRRKEQQERLLESFIPGKVIGRNDIVVNHALGKVKLEEDYIKVEVDEEMDVVTQQQTLGSSGSHLSCPMTSVMEEGMDSVLVKEEIVDNELSEVQEGPLGDGTPFEPISIENEVNTREALNKQLEEERTKTQALAEALAKSRAKNRKFRRLQRTLVYYERKNAQLKKVLEVSSLGHFQTLWFTDAELNPNPSFASSFEYKTTVVLLPGKLVELTSDPSPPTYRQLKLVDSFGLPTGPEKPIRKSNRIEFQKFLQRFGNQVQCFVGELVGFTQFDPNWYTTLVSWIQLMPNLQQLSLSMTPHDLFKENFNWKEEKLKLDDGELCRNDIFDVGHFVAMYDGRHKQEFPTLLGLKSFHLKECYLAFFTRVLKNSSNLENVGWQNILCSKMARYASSYQAPDFVIRLEKLSTLEVSTSLVYMLDSDEELNPHIHTWTPKKIIFDGRNFRFERIVRFVKLFEHSLEELELTLESKPKDAWLPQNDKNIKRCNSPVKVPDLELSNLKSLTINWTGPYPSNYPLTEVTSCIMEKAEKLTLKLFSWQNLTFQEGDATAEFFKQLDSLENTSIWKEEHYLKKFRVMRTACKYEWGVEIPEKEMLGTSVSRKM